LWGESGYAHVVERQMMLPVNSGEVPLELPRLKKVGKKRFEASLRPKDNTCSVTKYFDIVETISKYPYEIIRTSS
jgi:hypothetical protein